MGNPTGGTVVAGSATIGGAGATLTINQSTQNAIINWQQFSIASGELTKFIVPNSSSATLNRVFGGNPSLIYGSLQSNGILYLVNPSGIVVGPSGRIDTSSFLASTLDVSNQQFLAGGNLSFAGSSNASIENNGVIHASSGDVYLIANQVNNNGTLSAPQGNVGLAAGSDVLFQQAGNQHLFVQATPAGTTRATGVTNAGTIRAAAAELRAAGGNAYALAINNTGEIAATGYKKVNGQVYLTADGGDITNSGKISAQNANGNGGTIVVDGSGTSSTGNTVLNSGTLDASATIAGGSGGSVTLKNMSGTTIHSGQILAKGGQGGAGGNAEISGAQVQFTGTVDLTAPGGTTGDLLLDPTVLVVITTGTGTVVNGQNDSTSTEIDPTTVEAALGTANLTLNANTNITVTDGITWTSANTLTLSTNTPGSAIVLAAPISGVNGGLTIDAAAAGDGIAATGSVDVASFILQRGTWTQDSSTLPAFTASHDFELQGASSTFIRIAGFDSANGNAEEITDIYGLQGIASPSGSQLPLSFELMNNIDATGTATWNSSTGFVPIGDASSFFTGTFNGQGHTINGLYINTPGGTNVGLFSETETGALIENVGLTNVQITGGDIVGALVGDSVLGTITNTYSTGVVNGTSNVGGLAGGNGGTVTLSYSTCTVGGTYYVGGLVGTNYGTIGNSYSTGAVTGAGSGTDVGGLVGYNYNSYSLGTITNTYSTGVVSGGTVVGGLLGYNDSTTLSNNFWDTTTAGSGVVSGVGSDTTPNTTAGVMVATTTQLKTQSFFPSSWDFTTPVWTTDGGTLTPQLTGLPPTGLPTGGSGLDTLSGTAYIGNGTSPSSGVTIDLIYDGSQLGSPVTTNGSGGFSFSVSSADLTGGVLLTDATDNGNTYYQANSPASSISIDIWGGTLRVMADTASNTALKTVAGSLTTVSNGINYTVSGANLSTNAGVSMSILSHYALDGNITAAGAMLLSNASVTLNGGNFMVTGAGNSSNLDGIDMVNSTIDTQGGSINLTGQAGYDAQTQTAGIGVLVNNSIVENASSSEPGITGGGVTIMGTGSPGSENIALNNLIGVSITHSVMSVVDGALSITGDVNNGTAQAFLGEDETYSPLTGRSIGVIVDDGSAVVSTGTGSVSITGDTTSSTAEIAYLGVDISGLDPNSSTIVTSIVSAAGGLGVNITGTAGAINTSPGSNNDQTPVTAGLVIENGANITATGSAPITLMGTGGIDQNTISAGLTDETSEGITIEADDNGTTGDSPDVLISSATGAILLTGTGKNSIGSVDGIEMNSSSGETAAIASSGANIALNGHATNTADQSTNLTSGGDAGVDISSNSSTESLSSITASAGSIAISGTVTAGTLNSKEAGVVIGGGSHIVASGTGGETGATAQGDVAIVGNTTTSTAQSLDGGVFIDGADTLVSASGVVADASGGTGLTITGTASTINGSTAGTINEHNGTGGITLEPLTTGIGLVAGAEIETLGSAPMTLNGTGGMNSNSLDSASFNATTGGTSASYGVVLFSPVANQTTTLASGGDLLITGMAGSSPTTGVGVMIGGPSNVGAVSVTSSGAITLIGTGGSGYVTGGPVPNAGVAIFDPGNGTGSVNIAANGGNLSMTGTSGGGSNSTGVDGEPYFNAVDDSGSTDPGIATSGSLFVVSDSGLINNSGWAGEITALNTTVTAPVGTASVITAGAGGGPLSLNGGDFTVTGYPNGLLTLAASTVGNLSVTNNGGINLNGLITSTGLVNIQDTGGDITLGLNGSITDSSDGDNVILAAGTDPTNAHYIINNSSSANPIQVTGGGNFYLYSSDPTYDSFGEITVLPSNAIYGATYETTELPTVDEELFYVAAMGDVGSNLPVSTTPPPPPSTDTGGAAGGGSNIVPPALTPQPTPPVTPPSGNNPGPIVGNPPPPSPFKFTDNGMSPPTDQQGEGLANPNQVGADDKVELGPDGSPNNVANPQAAGVLNQALGPAVFNNLTAALTALGNWTAADTGGSGGSYAGGGNPETILSGGDVAEIGDNGVKNIPLGQAPKQLQVAMSGDVLNGMSSGAGH